MRNGHEHNRSVAWLRMFGAVAAQCAAERAAGTRYAGLAADFADFERRRFESACYALSTTKE